MLAAQVATALDDDLTVIVTSQVTFGAAPEVLADTAAGADLLVLGSHGHGRLFHAVLGSVADACVRTAPCPVVVVPVPRPEKVTSAPSGVPSAIF
jgi:nucleotide-binding universal stress UspA family protein